MNEFNIIKPYTIFTQHYQPRRQWFDPLSEKVPHASEQPSQGVTAAEPALPSQGAATTARVCHDYGSPHALQPVFQERRLRTTTRERRPSADKNAQTNKILKATNKNSFKKEYIYQ